ERFSRTWGWVEEAAAQSGKPVSRDNWKVVVTFHLAECKEEAIADLRHSFPKRAYVGDGRDPSRAALAFGPQGRTVEEGLVSGGVVVGTPDELIAYIEEVQERSGGIGGILALAHEWAGTAATHKSYELLARYVMPHFQGQLDPVLQARDWFDGNQ